MTLPKKLIWQIFPTNILIILAAILFCSVYGGSSFEDFYLQETKIELGQRAELIRSQIVDYLVRGDCEGLRHYCVKAGRNSGNRITVINEDGTVVADSNEDPARMDNHRHRVEIAEAFNDHVGSSIRYSRTLDEKLVYVAVPLRTAGEQGGVDAVLRTSVSVASLDKTLKKIHYRIAGGGLAVLLVAAAISLFVSRSITRPLEEMTAGAEQFSRGNFGERLSSVAGRSSSLEVIKLAVAMDRMAELLDEKLQAIVTHRNQLETVFSSMVEAVIAIDNEEHIISINAAAARLFGVEREKAMGAIVQQVVRNVKLQQQISHTLGSRESAESEILLPSKNGERFLQTHVVPLSNGQGEHVGVLVVMNDVTRLRRLEQVRRDFVANVSHELRTPITSIRGYVETILDGVLDDREQAEQFLAIVLRQSERLSSIIDDLLTLSRIEEDASKGAIQLDKQALQPVLVKAVQSCQLQAEKAGVSVELDCPVSLDLMLNPTLLEQALVNLLVNAITYSPRGSSVQFRARHIKAGELESAEEPMVLIEVEDHGCGIGQEHLPRLFERFYRSDKARSRARGGTGLGLAIVKHITQAHGGRVTVSSILDKGSTFSVMLPCNHADQPYDDRRRPDSSV